jgi:hypothetical protein
MENGSRYVNTLRVKDCKKKSLKMFPIQHLNVKNRLAYAYGEKVETIRLFCIFSRAESARRSAGTYVEHITCPLNDVALPF